MSTLQWKQALYQLRSRLVSGELVGGTKLRASHLAGEMGISRTPIGEALIKLEGEGLLICLLYTSPSPRDGLLSRMPSSA